MAITENKDSGRDAMILKRGEKIFVIHRQLLPTDCRRHFFGVVEECVGDLARVTGRVFSLDSRTNRFVPRDLPRTRIIPLGSGGVIINVLPISVNIDKITYTAVQGGQLHITDGTKWHLDITPA
jgi:hypothetical protein